MAPPRRAVPLARRQWQEPDAPSNAAARRQRRLIGQGKGRWDVYTAMRALQRFLSLPGKRTELRMEGLMNTARRHEASYRKRPRAMITQTVNELYSRVMYNMFYTNVIHNDYSAKYGRWVYSWRQRQRDLEAGTDSLEYTGAGSLVDKYSSRIDVYRQKEAFFKMQNLIYYLRRWVRRSVSAIRESRRNINIFFPSRARLSGQGYRRAMDNFYSDARQMEYRYGDARRSDRIEEILKRRRLE